MMKKRLILPVILVMCILYSRAQESPPNCDQPKSQLEMNICSAIEFQKKDSMMNVAYKKMIQAIDLTIQNSVDEKIKTTFATIKSNLVLSQTSFVQMRDAHGAIMRSIYTGESSEVLAVNLTLIGETEGRIKTLNEIFELLTEER